MKRICIVLGINEHRILKILENKVGVSLPKIREEMNDGKLHLKYYSMIAETLIRMSRKYLVSYLGEMSKLRYFRNHYSNKEREEEAHNHLFTITDKGRQMLKIFQE